MSDHTENNLNDLECQELFTALFPTGPAGTDVLRALAANGWDISPFRAIGHPSVEQRYKEAVRLHENLQSLAHNKNASDPPPSFEEIRATYIDPPDNPTRECLDIVCWCLWDIFSDTHDVLAPDGRRVDIGSFRGASAFLSGWAQRFLQGGERSTLAISTWEPFGSPSAPISRWCTN